MSVQIQHIQSSGLLVVERIRHVRFLIYRATEGSYIEN